MDRYEKPWVDLPDEKAKDLYIKELQKALYSFATTIPESNFRKDHLFEGIQHALFKLKEFVKILPVVRKNYSDLTSARLGYGPQKVAYWNGFRDGLKREAPKLDYMRQEINRLEEENRLLLEEKSKGGWDENSSSGQV